MSVYDQDRDFNVAEWNARLSMTPDEPEPPTKDEVWDEMLGPDYGDDEWGPSWGTILAASCWVGLAILVADMLL